MRIRILPIESNELCLYTLWCNGKPDSYRCGCIGEMIYRADYDGNWDITAGIEATPVYDKARIVWTSRKQVPA